MHSQNIPVMETKDHVRRHTPADVNERIEREILNSIRYYSHNKGEIPDRIARLEEEWDIERTLELNAAVVALAGTILAATVNRKWAILPAVVTVFLAQHAIQGWCPPLPLFRAMGVRTRKEIDSEKYALKALLGEFRATRKTREIWEAASQ
jgi:hypothetical protein